MYRCEMFRVKMNVDQVFAQLPLQNEEAAKSRSMRTCPVNCRIDGFMLVHESTTMPDPEMFSVESEITRRLRGEETSMNGLSLTIQRLLTGALSINNE